MATPSRFSLLILLALVCIVSFAAWQSGRFASDSQTSALDGLLKTPGIIVDSDRAEQADPQTLDASAEHSVTLTSETHPLDPLLDYAQEVKQRIEENVQDYTATLVKRERIDGQLGPETQMLIKVRSENSQAGIPFGVYLKFTEPRSARGREVIWVRGEREGKLIAHETGLLNIRSVQLDPTGMLAMIGNKYPITEVGLLRLAEKLIEKGERDRQIGPCEARIIENQQLGDRTCRLIQVTHPEPKAGYDFHVAQIFIDQELGVPIRYAAYMWPEKPGTEPLLEEEYTYLNLQLNVGLKPEDFDPQNSDYNFP